MSVYLKDGMVLLDSGSVATSSDCCCGGGACCANDGSGCFTEPDEDTCLALPGRWLGDGTTCDDIICAFCNGCYCAISGPFAGCNGADCDFWTRVESFCDPMTLPVYSGRTTFDALYVMQVQTQTCCPPDSGVQVVTDIAFCNNLGFGNFCDDVEIITGSISECSPVGTDSVVTELFGLVPTPC